MQPVDQTLLRLADPTSRPSLLTADGLLAIAQVCYDIDPAVVVGPTTAVYDTMDLAVAITPEVVASARWSRVSDPLPAEAAASLTGLVPPTPGADAVWSGSVVLRIAGGSGTITAATTALPNLDGAIATAVSALGPNPTPAQVLGAQRAAAKAQLGNPALTDTELDAVLAGVLGSGPDQSPTALGLATGGRRPVDVELTFSAIPNATELTPPVALPVVVAFLVADSNASPRALLQQSEPARRAAARYDVMAPPKNGPRRTRPTCVCWLIPATSFDDSDWPGASGGSANQQRLDRLAAARKWLTAQGIAVVTT
jgi:hypothetical protein